MKFSRKAEAALRRRGGRMTRARRALLELIEKSPRPLAPTTPAMVAMSV